MSSLRLEGSRLRSAATAHVVVVPFPAPGHVNPLRQFSKRLAACDGVIVSLVMVDGLQQGEYTTEAHNPAAIKTKSDKSGHGTGVRTEYVSMADWDMSKGFGVSLAGMVDAVAALGRPVGELIARLDLEVHPVSCIIYDSFLSTWAQTVATNLHIPAFAFITCSISLNLLWFYMKSLISKELISVEEAVSGFVEDPHRVITDLQGLPPLSLADLPSFRHVENDTEYLYRWNMRDAEHLRMAEGIVSNTFSDLESEAIATMEQEVAPVFSVGPLIGDANSGSILWEEDSTCLAWLDTQPAGSVLYISFGSITILSVVEFEEIVLGLEASQQRFLLVFRPDLIDNSAYDGIQYIKERTKNQGCVVSWSPQLLVLSHPAVGGFLTHCGWNSTLESIVNGIPMVCFPYFSDQTLNCRFITTVWKIGIQLKRDAGLLSRDEVERVLRELMEGEEGNAIRKRAIRLQEAARRSLAEGGSSQKSLEGFVAKLRNSLTPS